MRRMHDFLTAEIPDIELHRVGAIPCRQRPGYDVDSLGLRLVGIELALDEPFDQ